MTVGHGAVKHRVIEVPAGWPEDDGFNTKFGILAGGKDDRPWLPSVCRHDFAVRIDQTHPHRHPVRGIGLVDYGGPDPHGCPVVGHLRCADRHAVVFQMHGVGDDQPHMAVDARASVPAGGGLRRVVRTHGQEVGLVATEEKVPGQFVAETDVTIGSVTQQRTIDPYVAVRHDPVELDEDTSPGRIGREGESFAIPADAARQERARAARRSLRVEGTFDAPIMRHVERAPRRVVEVQLFPVLDVPFEKSPASIEILMEAVIFPGVARDGVVHPEEQHAEQGTG